MAIAAILIFCSLKTQAQVAGNIVNLYGRYADLTTTSPMQEALGLGNFTVGTGNLPVARLHINTFRMGPSSDNQLDPFSEGFLFRTDGDQSITNQWDLWTGTSSTSQTERFRLYTDVGTTPFIGFRSLSNGMRFETGGSDIRLRINGSQTSTINGFTVNNSGFACLSNNQAFWSGAVSSPYSLLHLAGSGTNTQELGYRPWMIDGITFTGNSDMSFVGPRAISNDLTEFVIAWSDNTNGSTGPDDFVVRFTNGDGTASSGPASAEGLEMMRFAADADGKVGVGDEFGITTLTRPQRRLHVHDPGTNNITDAQLRISQNITNVFTDFRSTQQGNLYLNMNGTQQRVGIEEPDPIETLDVNGNLRLQNTPVLSPDCVFMGQNVASGVPEDNRMTRLDLTNDPSTYLAGDGTWQNIGTTSCDWNLVTNGTSDDLVMGYAGACNEGNVGIGVNNPNARLEVNASTLLYTMDSI